MRYRFPNISIQTALALSAASALIYEIVATKILFFYFIESTYSLSTVLSVFLLGLGIGSFSVYKFSHKIKNKKNLFGYLQIAIAIYVFFVLANLTIITSKISNLGIILTSFAVLLIPTIFLGAAFPLAGSIFIDETKEIIGLVYSSDLVGAILGALASGFVLIPTFGIKSTIFVGAGLNLLSAIIILNKKRKILPILLLCVLIILSFSSITSSYGTIKNQGPEKGYQFYANSPYGIIIVKNDTLSIDGREQCSLSYPEDASERQMVNYAFQSIQKENPKVLNIGLGCGLTASSVLSYPNVHLDIVEINPVIVAANKEFTNVLENKRADLILADGLNYLRKTKEKYDIILIDVEDPQVAYSSYLYTVESFKLVNETLTEEGVFALWNYEDVRLDIMYYSLKEAFPFVYQYPGVFLATKKELDKEEYSPKTPYKINTIDKNELAGEYLANAPKPPERMF